MADKLTPQKQKWINIIKNSKKLFNKYDLMKDICRNKDVLDVGCVGQDIDYTKPNWIHGQIKKVAKNLIGVDINEEGIKKLREIGYEVYKYDNLKDDKKYDVILMLDVIEHVDNPVALLNNYKKFLKKNGIIVVTTPNSNRAINPITIFFKNDYPLNYEHTFWLCPKTFLEIVNRTNDLEPKAFYWLEDYNDFSKLSLKRKIFYYITKFLVIKSSNFAPNFMFIIGKK